MSTRHALVVAVILWGVIPTTAQPARSPADRSAVPARSLDGRVAVYPAHLTGRTMTSGVRYEPRDLVAAHATLPLGTRLQVSDGSRRVIVTVRDRGPFDSSIVLLVSEAAAQGLGLRDTPLSMHIALAEADGDPDHAVGIGVQADEPVGSETGTSGGERSGGAWSVQLGSFSDERGARQMANRIEGARFERISENGDVVWKVYFGRFEDRESATAWRDRLRGWGYDGFVREVER